MRKARRVAAGVLIGLFAAVLVSICWQLATRAYIWSADAAFYGGAGVLLLLVIVIAFLLRRTNS